MKNRSIFCGVFIVIVVAALLVTGCVTSSRTTSNIISESTATFGEAVRIPVKDFDSLGLVFTEFTLTLIGDNFQGNVLTYQALLREARNLGADAIINVTIDRVTRTRTRSETTTTARGGPASSSNNVVTEHTWYGTALAIRYTTALTQEGLVVNDVRRIGAGGNTSQAPSSTQQADEPSSGRRGLFGRR